MEIKENRNNREEERKEGKKNFEFLGVFFLVFQELWFNEILGVFKEWDVYYMFKRLILGMVFYERIKVL